MRTDGGTRAMRELDCEYYARRQRESLARADAAGDARVVQIHREFAAAYGARLHEEEEQRPRYSAWR